jgi:PAS domain S-box-containing protein
LGVIALSALGQWTSAFFLPGQGGTPLRQFVLSSGMAMFGLTAAVLWGTGRRPLSAFTYWYGLALALMAAGLFGAMIPSAQYSLLDWTGRATQFLGGVYMVIAAIASVRETRVWGLPLEAALRESEARFRIMADGSPILIWVTDAHGGVQFINRTYREFFGVTYEYVQGNLWQPLIHPEDTAAYTGAFLDAVRQRRPFKAEARVRRADGQWRWIDSHAEPHWSLTGEFLGHIGASPDITERKGAEEKLRELNATLECKVGQRTAELERRARQLQKLTLELSQAEDRERQRVAAILHEDLQQQIAGAKFHLGLLKNRTRNSRAQREVVDRVDEMLRDAIEKSRSLSHDLSPPVTQANDLAEALQWLAHRVRAQHGLTVRVGVLGAVPLQAEALTMFLFRAAQELLFNVVKHAQVKEAAVRVRRMGRCVYLSVADRGCGFDPQELRETSGFGLLSIRERVELLGGRMKIRSAKGQGSRFRIVLPDERKIQATRHQVEEGKQRTTDRFASSVLRSTSCDRALRLLLADDHEIVREGLVSLLKEVPGIEVVGEAANGREAVHLADELRPDVVAMDVSMPVMGGEEAARLIKRRLPATRIVALSMHEEIEAMDRMHQAGAESYVLKTAPSEDLLAAIRGCRPA